MKTATDRVAETGPGIADGRETVTMTETIAEEAVIGITEPGEMIHATAIAGVRMILLT